MARRDVCGLLTIHTRESARGPTSSFKESRLSVTLVDIAFHFYYTREYWIPETGTKVGEHAGYGRTRR